VRVDQTNLISVLGAPNISKGSSTAFAEVPTLVWPISGTGVHITIYPGDQWKFSQMQAESELEERRQLALKADDDEALELIRGWRSEGKSEDEIERLFYEYIDSHPAEFDPSLEKQPLDVGAITFDEWHLTNSDGSAFFNEQGGVVNSDSETVLNWARQNAGYFTNDLGLTVR
jgi:hypothetical protein